MAFFSKSKTAEAKDSALPVPEHIAFIMDGNNRWAKKRLLPGIAGHKQGVETIRDVLKVAQARGVKAITLFAFSSENWKRPPKEVEALMSLFLAYLQREVDELHANGTRVRVIGARDKFSAKLLTHIERAEALTQANTTTTLTICADYGGQWDIVNAAKTFAQKVEAGEYRADDLDENLFDQFTCLSDMPKPELCIRTSGEFRISNFLLWQLAYSEFYITDAYWPDFDEAEFDRALRSYQLRERRFGQTSEQVQS